ncbi:hypothetical protein F2P56_031787 [Juglans regia]|uniref:Bifunctional inhibitor/plant lipid transfer protein/seed storage helical domain-containing protein n=1 Tax=Juglans regia TaxID=51240 RepID=A0A833TB09_JUGRE|nr:hypothetical protein F2P56_031787 [Juglans regia]
MLVVITMIQFMTRPSEAITFGQVESSLAPCPAYLIAGGDPSTECRKGVETIKASCPNTAEKREACECVKQAAIRLPNLKDDLAVDHLPNKCKVQMDIPISRTTKYCNT